MDGIISFLNNRYLIAAVVGLFLVSMLGRFARR